MAEMEKLSGGAYIAYICLLVIIVLVYYLGMTERTAARKEAIEHCSYLSKQIETLRAELKTHDEKLEWWERDDE